MTDMDRPSQHAVNLAVEAAIRRYETIVEQGKEFEMEAASIAEKALSILPAGVQNDVDVAALYQCALGTFVDLDAASDSPRPLRLYQ